MSRLTHNICASCWNLKNPDREAHHLAMADEEPCCFCGKPNRDGIYIRESPENTMCGGKCAA